MPFLVRQVSPAAMLHVEGKNASLYVTPTPAFWDCYEDSKEDT